MNFGFLIDKSEVKCQSFSIIPNENFDEYISWFYHNMEVSNGWIYPPFKALKHNDEELKKFKKSAPLVRSSFYTLPCTHILQTQNFTDEHKRFLVLGYGLLQGLYLNPQNYMYLGKIPYTPSTLNGLVLGRDDRVKGLEAINKFYINANNVHEISQMQACIHWFLIAQTLDFQWEIFDAHYKVLDGLYRLLVHKIGKNKVENLNNDEYVKHSQRFIVLAKYFNLEIPNWADNTKTGNDNIAFIRNELVHEAKYAGQPIGYNYPNENFKLQFKAFNLKLICAFLGINTPYLQAPANNRMLWSWSIQ